MSKQMEAFEAWASQWTWFGADSKNAAWEAWQASRAAALEGAAGIFDQMSNRMLEADECAEAIRALKEQS